MAVDKPVVIELDKSGEYQSLLRGKPKTCGMRAGRVFLSAGDQCGQHSTEAKEELLVFLAGTGQALIGEKQDTLQVGEGMVCYIPPHTVHNIQNIGQEPLVYIYCVVPVQDDK